MPSHWYWKRRKVSSAYSPTPVSYSSTSVTVSLSPNITQAGPEIKDLGLAIEPIVGGRTFDVSTEGDDIGLHSINGVYWPPRKALTAYCLNNPFAAHESPHIDCQCGIYSWNLEQAAGFPNTLWGEVYLWGDVIVCDLGYRAEFAYPKELHINATATRAAQRIRDGLEATYGVPVTLSDPDKPKDLGHYTGPAITYNFADPRFGPPAQGAGGL